MIETTITLRKLTAADGYVLTDGKVFGREVYLGKHDSPENWKEITEAEAEAICKAREEETNAC